MEMNTAELLREIENLQWKESLLQMMANSSPLAFYVVDNRTDEILYFNRQFCEIWGICHLEERIRNRELKNNDIISECLPVLKDVESFAESCKPLQAEEYRGVVEDEIPFNDGRVIRRFTAQIRGADDKYFGRLYLFEDITQRKTAEESIRIQRDLATGFSMVSDLNEALNLAINSVMQFDGVDFGGVYLIDRATGMLKLWVHHGLADEFIEKNNYYEPQNFHTMLVLHGKPVYTCYTNLKQPENVDKNDPDILALAIIPIQHEGVVIGCMNLGSKTRKEFNQKISGALEAVAFQMGGAVSRITAEKALLSSKQNFQMLFDTIDDFMFILDVNGNIMKTNPVAQKRLGYSERELQHFHVLAVHPADRREEAGFIVKEMLQGNATFCPVPLITRDGVLIPVETRVIAGKWDGSDVLYGISRDVTERQKAERELQLRESILSAVINNHPGMFWLKDLEGKLLLLNDRNDEFLKLLQVEEESILIGKTDFDFMSKEDSDRYLTEDQQVIQTREPLVIEEQKSINGESRWFEKNKFPVVDKYGEVIGVSAYSIEITERKTYEQALLQGMEREKELNELKSKFISMASHEFKTPLATIMATSELLLAYGDQMTREEQNLRLGKINDQVAHLNNMIEEVLCLSKLHARDVALKPEHFDLVEMFRRTVLDFNGRSDIGGRLEFRSGTDSIEVLQDKSQISQVLNNLLSNAFKYSDPAFPVVLTLMKNAQQAMFAVSDQGIGIPGEEIKHLFQPFYRASNVGNIAGTGLGLNIVMESVNRLGGSITVVSNTDKGATFTVNLPISVHAEKLMEQ